MIPSGTLPLVGSASGEFNSALGQPENLGHFVGLLIWPKPRLRCNARVNSRVADRLEQVVLVRSAMCEASLSRALKYSSMHRAQPCAIASDR